MNNNIGFSSTPYEQWLRFINELEQEQHVGVAKGENPEDVIENMKEDKFVFIDNQSIKTASKYYQVVPYHIINKISLKKIQELQEEKKKTKDQTAIELFDRLINSIQNANHKIQKQHSLIWKGLGTITSGINTVTNTGSQIVKSGINTVTNTGSQIVKSGINTVVNTGSQIVKNGINTIKGIGSINHAAQQTDSAQPKDSAKTSDVKKLLNFLPSALNKLRTEYAPVSLQIFSTNFLDAKKKNQDDQFTKDVLRQFTFKRKDKELYIDDAEEIPHTKDILNKHSNNLEESRKLILSEANLSLEELYKYENDDLRKQQWCEVLKMAASQSTLNSILYCSGFIMQEAMSDKLNWEHKDEQGNPFSLNTKFQRTPCTRLEVTRDENKQITKVNIKSEAYLDLIGESNNKKVTYESKAVYVSISCDVTLDQNNQPKIDIIDWQLDTHPKDAYQHLTDQILDKIKEDISCPTIQKESLEISMNTFWKDFYKEKKGIYSQFAIDIERNINFIIIDEQREIKDRKPAIQGKSDRKEQATKALETIYKGENEKAAKTWESALKTVCTQTFINALFYKAKIDFLSTAVNSQDLDREDYHQLLLQFENEQLPFIQLKVDRDENSGKITKVHVKIEGHLDAVTKEKQGQTKTHKEQAVSGSLSFSLTLDNKDRLNMSDAKYNVQVNN